VREEHWAFPDLNNHGNDEGTQLVGTGGRQVGDTSTLPEADAYVCMIVCKTTMHTAFSLAKWRNEGNNVRNKSGKDFFLASDCFAGSLCIDKFYRDQCTILRLKK
jgi:hypothetical protein